MIWIKTEERLPPEETPVLIVYDGTVRIGELRWDHPGWEETYQSYLYWDDPNDDGQDWCQRHITHWSEVPEPPELPNEPAESPACRLS